MVYLKSHLALIAFFFYGIVDSAMLERQTSISQENGAVIDSVFNIPITAIKQTAKAVQSFSPENSETIDNVFKIPISTLQAVERLVKNRNPQKRQDLYEEKIKRQKLKRDKLYEKHEQHRLQKLRKEEIKKKKFQLHKEKYYLNKAPFIPVNNVLSSLQGLGNQGSGLSGNKPASNGHVSHTYEVHEFIDEPPFVWPGWPGSTFVKIENKIAPRDERPEALPLEDKVAPKEEKKPENPESRNNRRSSFRFESDLPPTKMNETPKNV